MKSLFLIHLLISPFLMFANSENLSKLIFQLDLTNIQNINKERKNWLIVNDSVMGGRSFSQIDFLENGLEFTGGLSLENNGGFASVRRRLVEQESNLADYIKLTVQGDGRAYKIRFRLNGYLDGPAYETKIKTKKLIKTNQLQEFVISQSDFKAVFRSRELKNAPEFDLSDALQFEIMLADKEVGDFKLILKEISFFNKN